MRLSPSPPEGMRGRDSRCRRPSALGVSSPDNESAPALPLAWPTGALLLHLNVSFTASPVFPVHLLSLPPGVVQGSPSGGYRRPRAVPLAEAVPCGPLPGWPLSGAHLSLHKPVSQLPTGAVTVSPSLHVPFRRIRAPCPLPLPTFSPDPALRGPGVGRCGSRAPGTLPASGTRRRAPRCGFAFRPPAFPAKEFLGFRREMLWIRKTPS